MTIESLYVRLQTPWEMENDTT